MFKRGSTLERRDRCGLCGKSKEEAKRLIVGLHSAVCSDCIDLCVTTLYGDAALSKGNESAPDPLCELRLEVCGANIELHRQALVRVHSGNASGLDAEAGVVLIKPSGIDFEQLTPESLVAVELESGIAAGSHKPSVDLPHHLFLYRNLPGIRGIVHTHSNFATAFAALEKPIPCALTAIADEFGGEIPCAPYVDNEGDAIGRAILEHRSERSPAILLGRHGVFAWGDSPAAALKAAAMAEDAAKTVWLAMQMGEPKPLPQAEIEKWWDRYQNRYGQSPSD